MLDTIDKKLINLLQQDSKQTTKQLSLQLNLSVTAVYERVKKLENQKVIEKYVAIVNKNKIEKSFLVFCHIKLMQHSKEYLNTFEYEILKIIPNQLKRMYISKDYSPIIPLTEILFNIDSLNETAFYYRIHTLHNMDLTLKAKKQFNDYIIRYNKIMGDNFPSTYKDVIKQIPDELI